MTANAISSARAKDATDEASVATRIESIRQGDPHSLGDLLQLYRRYLSVLASTQMDDRLRRRFSCSDLVQETMLAAHRDFHQFRGRSEGELLAWLRQVLSNCFSHALEKHVYAQKRDIRREVAVDAVVKKMDQSMARLSNIIADRNQSPSEILQQRELADALMMQLSKLKDSYRDVIVLRNLQGLSFDEIAEQMNIKPGTARMTWVRAIAKFKEIATPVN